MEGTPRIGLSALGFVVEGRPPSFGFFRMCTKRVREPKITKVNHQALGVNFDWQVSHVSEGLQIISWCVSFRGPPQLWISCWFPLKTRSMGALKKRDHVFGGDTSICGVSGAQMGYEMHMLLIGACWIESV